MFAFIWYATAEGYQYGISLPDMHGSVCPPPSTIEYNERAFIEEKVGA